MFAAEIRGKRVERLRALPQWRQHLDEVFVKINGASHYRRRAVDHEGDVLEVFVSKKRDGKAALKFARKAVKRHGPAAVIGTDKLRSHGAALKDLGIPDDRKTGRWLNSRAENSHQPFADGNVPSSVSDGREPCRNSSPSIPPSTTISTPSATNIAKQVSN